MARHRVHSDRPKSATVAEPSPRGSAANTFQTDELIALELVCKLQLVVTVGKIHPIVRTPAFSNAYRKVMSMRARSQEIVGVDTPAQATGETG